MCSFFWFDVCAVASVRRTHIYIRETHMYIHIYICIYMYMYIHVYTCIYMYIYIHVYTCIYMYVYTYVYMVSFGLMCVLSPVCDVLDVLGISPPPGIFMCICVYIFIYIYLYLCVNMYIYIYICVVFFGLMCVLSPVCDVLAF